MTLHVRTEGDPAALLEKVRDEIGALAPGLPLTDVRPLRELVEEDLWLERALAMLLSAFGALALILATVGVYGVLARAVSQRRREMGLRMAIGAQRSDVLRSIFAEGLMLVAAGVALGLAAAAALMKLSSSLSSQLQGVSVTDWSVYAGAVGLLFAVALLGFLLPALRAARTDPATALHME